MHGVVSRRLMDEGEPHPVLHASYVLRVSVTRRLLLDIERCADSVAAFERVLLFVHCMSRCGSLLVRVVFQEIGEGAHA